jgi:serine/threonine protein kinase
MLRPPGEALLLDFGFSRHAHYPDLLGEEQHFAAGSAAYVSPEQLQDDRSDSRSDLYALGVLLYELATGEPPFGEPTTLAGMRDRLWREPVPPRALRRTSPVAAGSDPALPRERSRGPLSIGRARRARSSQSRPGRAVGARVRAEAPGFLSQLGRWWRARRNADRRWLDEPRALPRAVVILVAVDTEHPTTSGTRRCSGRRGRSSR